ncbi:MAG: ATP-binding cassette domain-containing protein, partial [Synergistaceae bacterium]
MAITIRSEFEVLKAEHLVKSYNKRRVVDNVSIEIKKGEIVGLLGPNGAGKSTTFYMMIGRIMPESGRVFNGEKDITALPMYERARTGLGYLPQEASVFRKLTVRQNLELVLEEAGTLKEERDAKIETLLEGYGLKQIENILGVSLSGGERRRVEIARCLA